MGGYLLLEDNIFKTFTYAIYDACLESEEKGQGYVEVKDCKFYESEEYWTSVVRKGHSDNTWGNKKKMLYDYEFYFSNCSFDRRLITFSSEYHGKKDIPNLAFEIDDLVIPMDDKIEELETLINNVLYYNYTDSEMEVTGKINSYLNNPTRENLNDFFLDIFKLCNLKKINLYYEDYFLNWAIDTQYETDPVYSLCSNQKILDEFVTPQIFINSNNSKNLLDFIKQAQNCFIEGEPLNVLMYDIPAEKSEFFRKNINIYNDFYNRVDYCKQALNHLLNKAKQLPDFFTPEEYNRIERFRYLFLEYYNLYDKFLKAQLFDIPLNYLYLAFMNQIFYNLDDRDNLERIALKFTDFGVIKYNCSVLYATSDNFDQILEMFKDYLGKKEYEEIQAKAKTTPQWFKNSAVQLLKSLE